MAAPGDRARAVTSGRGSVRLDGDAARRIRARRSRPRRRKTAGLVVATSAALAWLASRPATTITQIIDCPVVRTVTAPADPRHAEPEPAETADAVAPASAEARLSVPRSIDPLTVVALAALEPGPVPPMPHAARFDDAYLAGASGGASHERPSASAAHPDGDSSTPQSATLGCDDGSERMCPIPRACLPDEHRARGAGRLLDLRRARHLRSARPATHLQRRLSPDLHHRATGVRGTSGCRGAQRLLALRGRVHLRVAVIVGPPQSRRRLPSRSVATGCARRVRIAPRARRTAVPVRTAVVRFCGNGFCEVGEDHASCPADCCELGPSGSCAAICGNGMCEPGEDHASCAGDCCETTSSGACVAHCGNGFCEIGEDAPHCPADCP